MYSQCWICSSFAVLLMQNNLYKLFLVNRVKSVFSDILRHEGSYRISWSLYGGVLYSSATLSTTVVKYSWLELWCCKLFSVKWQRGFQSLKRAKCLFLILLFQGFLNLVFFCLSFSLASSWVCQSWCPFVWLASLLIWWCQWKSGVSFTVWWCMP